MSWPSAQDYVEAVQNPTHAFDDIDLKGACPEETLLGLPRVISGQFACVFKFTSPGKAWAVRCFLRGFDDNHDRYVEISKALRSEGFAFTVGFEFVERGIRIREKWFPIIKMEWLSGQLLGNFIAANASSQATLLDLANQIASIHTTLRDRRIAHGDLQHGNVIVNGQGRLFLIDYDGMFVPALTGKGSHEIGHRNYQHPFRSESDYDEGVDTFSVWIIYLSLVILAQDPSLWAKLQGGDDSILLKASDFKEPYSSEAFRTLKSHSNETVEKAAFLIEALCYADLRALPVFDPSELSIVAAHPKPKVAGAAPDWISEWVSKPNGHAEATLAGSGWIAEHITVSTPKFSEGRKDELRPWLYSILGSFASYLIPLFAGGLRQVVLAILVQALAIGAALACMYEKYRQEKVLQEKRAIEAARENIYFEIEINREELSKHRIELESLGAEQKKIQAATALDSSRIDTAMHSALKKLGEEHTRERQNLHSRKISLSNAEDGEKSLIQTNYTGRINALRNEIAAASAQLKAELAIELKKQQDSHLMSSLARYRISDANISGIGEKLTTRLQRAGIYTAADASHSRVMSVDGIGHQKGATIKRWRDALVYRVQGSLPTQLDKITEVRVRAKFASATTAKEGQVHAFEQQRDTQLGAIAEKFKVQKDPVENALKALDAENTKKCNEARADAEKERAMSRTLAINATKAVNESLEHAQHEIRRTEGEAGRLAYRLSLSEKKLSAYSQIRFTKWLWSRTKLPARWQ